MVVVAEGLRVVALLPCSGWRGQGDMKQLCFLHHVCAPHTKSFPPSAFLPRPPPLSHFENARRRQHRRIFERKNRPTGTGAWSVGLGDDPAQKAQEAAAAAQKPDPAVPVFNIALDIVKKCLWKGQVRAVTSRCRRLGSERRAALEERRKNYPGYADALGNRT